MNALSRLEQSFVDIAAKHNFTVFGVMYRGEEFGPAYRFEARAHFDDAASGQIPCASGDGASIAAAIHDLVDKAESKRRIPLTGEEALYGDDALLEDAA